MKHDDDFDSRFTKTIVDVMARLLKLPKPTIRRYLAGESAPVSLELQDQVITTLEQLPQLKEERDELRHHWDRVAKHVIMGEQDTAETVLEMMKENESLKTKLDLAVKSLQGAVVYLNSWDVTEEHEPEYQLLQDFKKTLREIGSKEISTSNENLINKRTFSLDGIQDLLNCVKFYADVNNWSSEEIIIDPEHVAAQTLERFRKRYGWEL